MPDEFDKFVGDETTRIDDERKKAMEGKDFKPFIKLEVGENHLVFARTIPRENKKFANRVIFRVTKNGEEMDLTVGKSSPLYREILNNLKVGKFKLKITRVGTGRGDTRYSVTAE